MKIISKAHIYNITAISIGVPSSVQPDKSTVICTTNIRNQKGEVVFKNTNLSEELESYFHIPVFVNNDINNILLYDVMKNHLEGQKVIVGIYIGTGVGASVLLDGKLLEGKNGAELDIGHIPYYGHTAPCSCGKSGCCGIATLLVGNFNLFDLPTFLIPI
ncbi:MAG: ROK family protein [Ruminococcus sp.]